MIPTQQDIAEFTRFQRNEITESILYERLASIEKDENNRKTLRLIAAEEKSHYAILKKYTGKGKCKRREYRVREYREQ